MPDVPRLQTERLELRLAEEPDVAGILRFRERNNSFLRPYEPFRPPDFMSEEFWRRQVRVDHEQFHTDRSVRFHLFARKDGEVVGTANFTSFQRGSFQSCFLGYALGERHQGTGLMSEALRGAIPYVFGELNLHRISANYLPENTRSAVLLRRLGFAVEGYARDYLHIAGRWQDHILTSLLNPDWRALP